MLKTHNCGELNLTHTGQRVTLAGWVHRRRDHGALIFLDLRDRSGLVQVTCDAQAAPSAHGVLNGVRGEYVVQIEGLVQARPEGLANPNLPTGMIEVAAQSATVLNEARTPPFYIADESDVDEALRLRYRYLDLRRAPMQRNIVLRHQVVKQIRDYMDRLGFLEIETPILIKSTPEGARDYVVPSRVHPGEFYALPQSPQQLKQLLMVAGYERYFQIARCFRDEDLRADRQPEFTQLDVEMSFVDREDVLATIEPLFIELIAALGSKPIATQPFPILTYPDAMQRFGSDKPDLRFGMELIDLTALVARQRLQRLFLGRRQRWAGQGDRGARLRRLQPQASRRSGGDGEAVRCKRAGLDCPRRGRQRSLAHRQAPGRFDCRSTAGLRRRCARRPLADRGRREPERGGPKPGRAAPGPGPAAQPDRSLGACTVLGGRIPAAGVERGGEPLVRHAPSLHVRHGFRLAAAGNRSGRVRAKAYDLVLDGWEVGGGSIRIHRRDQQQAMFKALGISPEQVESQFGHLLEAFEFGAPPHGGIALGIDRTVAIFAGSGNIRDVIAFPKTASATDLMFKAPSAVSDAQLRELHLRIVSD